MVEKMITPDINNMFSTYHAALTKLEIGLDERFEQSVNVISPDTGERHLFKILTALAEIKSAGSLGLHTVLGDLRNFTPRSPVMVISTLENDKTSATALREITARGFKLTVIAPDTLDYDRDSRTISPTVYFTASASFVASALAGSGNPYALRTSWPSSSNKLGLCSLFTLSNIF